MKMEFNQARKHFEIELEKQRSIINRIKSYFVYGRAVVNKQLYKKYKELTIQNGVHNLHGSLHIVKFSDNQDYGMILLKQQEFKILDLFIQRIEQIQQILVQLSQPSMLASNSSSPVPNSIDKSDTVVNPTTQTNIGMNQLNGDNVAYSHNLQQTKQNIESPGTVSNIESTAFKNFKYQMHSFSNNFNDVNQCQSKHYQQQTGSHFNIKVTNNFASVNTRNPAATICNQIQNDTFHYNSWVIKARLLIQTILCDLKEYQLSCSELCCPEYKKYRIKWIPQESKDREEYENKSQYKINDYNTKQQNLQFEAAAIQQMQIVNMNQGQQAVNDNFIECIFAADIQSYSLNRKQKGIYSSVASRIEDLYQQRTTIINLKLIIDSFVKILQFGEKTPINIEQFYHIDPDMLSNEEKLKLRETYGDQIIEESSERVVLVPNMKTQATGVFNQGQYGFSIQTSPLQSRTDRPNPVFQEEDCETFRDMILSILQSVYTLYKDNSTSISVKVHRLYSKEGFFNPSLKYRRRYLCETIKANLLFQQNQNQKMQNNNNNININANNNHNTLNPNQQYNYPPSSQFIDYQYSDNASAMKKLFEKRQSIYVPPYNEKKNEVPQQISMSNIQNVSSKNSPIKQLKASQLHEPDKAGQFYYQMQQIQENQLKNQQQQQQQLQQHQQQQYSEDTTENNQSFNNQTNNQPQSATKKAPLLSNMPEQMSQTMSNSNQIFAGQTQMHGNINYHQVNQIYHQYQQYNPAKNTFQPNSMNEFNQTSLIQSGNQQQYHDVRSGYSPQQNKQSINLNGGGGSPQEVYHINTQQVEEIIDRGRYRKLRVARINIEIVQSINNDLQMNPIQKASDCLSQMEEYIQYLSPLPLIYLRKEQDHQIIHSYSFYVENYVYLNNLPEIMINEFQYYNDVQSQNFDKIESQEECVQQRYNQQRQDEADFDEQVIVSLDAKQKDIKNLPLQKKYTQNLDRISEKNFREERVQSDTSQSQQNKFSQIQKDNTNSKKGQSKTYLQPSSRVNLNVDGGNHTPFLSYQNSNIGSFQKSQDNLDQVSDRKFFKGNSNSQNRDQQISFNGKLDGTQSPFYEPTQDYTQLDLMGKENERKLHSAYNFNYSMNDASNNGFTDRINVDEASADRKLSDNIAKHARPEETTARPNQSKSIERLSKQQITQKDLDQSINKEDQPYNKQESIRSREREFSIEAPINQVRDSDGLIKNMFQKSQGISLQRGNSQIGYHQQHGQTLKIGRSNSSVQTQRVSDNQSECSDFEYKKDLIDERDEKELTIILERSEQNNSLYNNTHYKNQLNKQLSSKITDYHGTNQHSFLNYKSQFQSQLLTDDQKQNYSNISKHLVQNSQGAKELQYFDSQQYDGRSLLHNNIQISTYQQPLNSFLSGGGTTNNQTSQNIETKFSKEVQQNKDLLISQKMI